MIDNSGAWDFSTGGLRGGGGGGGSAVQDESLLCQVSPPGFVSEPVPSQISQLLRSADVARSPSGLARMDQYLPWSASLPVGESTYSPLLPAPLTPRRIIKKLISESVVASPTGETSVAVAQPRMPDLSREGPFDVHQDCSTSGASSRVLDSMSSCRYHMMSYDEENGGPDFNPAYGIHLHDPRLLEYVGAPESARLLSHSPEYWLHHLRHENTLSAALLLSLGETKMRTPLKRTASPVKLQRTLKTEHLANKTVRLTC